MKPLDEYFVRLQFRDRVHSKIGAEFQTFFESIMEKFDEDFIRIRSVRGDGGNDGYSKRTGVYYQVYAPMTPELRLTEAAAKLEDDFEKLRTLWDRVTTIREYRFVFNDKYAGSTKELEQATSALHAANPSIAFNTFRAIDLERIFFQLDAAAMMDLGINIDSRQAIEYTRRYLDQVDNAFDREELKLAQGLLGSVKEIVGAMQDSDLHLRYELLECRLLQKLEHHNDALDRYSALAAEHPKDPRPLLQQAELLLGFGQPDSNLTLLEQARALDPSHWLLRLERIIRAVTLSQEVDPVDLDDSTFPVDAKMRANHYRVCAWALEMEGDEPRADSYLATARRLDPERFSTYIDELRILEHRMRKSTESAGRLELAKALLQKVESVQLQFTKAGDLQPRSLLKLELIRLAALLELERISSVERSARMVFTLALKCDFDGEAQFAFEVVLSLVQIHRDALEQLLRYLKMAKMQASETLWDLLFAQFCMRGNLLTAGREVFAELGREKYVNYINALAAHDTTGILNMLEGDAAFHLLLAGSLKEDPDTRRFLIEKLPDDKDLQKDKLRLLLSLDQEEFGAAFEILRGLQLEKLSYAECRPLLDLAHRKQAWEYVNILVGKLLEKEESDEARFLLRLHRFEAWQHLGNFAGIIDLGEELLIEDDSQHRLDSDNREALLAGTVSGCLERGKVDSVALDRAIQILEEHPLKRAALAFRIGVEAECYLRIGDGKRALDKLLSGVAETKVLSPQQYARLYFHFAQIANLIELDEASAGSVEDGSFVKLTGRDEWYYMGTQGELDAIKVEPGTSTYAQFANKKVGEDVTLGDKYGPELTPGKIQLIFDPSKYIQWQTRRYFGELAPQGLLEGVRVIAIPGSGDSSDFKNLERFFEDIEERTGPLFERYCQGGVPLAMLALSEGGLVPAIGRIGSEGRGFINCSDGTLAEQDQQMAAAHRILKENQPVYIDATSALMLAESGLLEKVVAHVPRLLVPQSVLNLLAEFADRFTYTAGQVGQLGYAKGHLVVSSLDVDQRDATRSRIQAAIGLLEADPDDIHSISAANKATTFSEAKVPAALADACILAKRDGAAILTEDFWYVRFNEVDTGAPAPMYCGSLSFVRALYEAGSVNFTEYLRHFSLLASYRCRFLSLSAQEIRKTVFGEGAIQTAIPTNIRQLHLSLTLSEAYGVTLKTALAVVASFLVDVLVDNTITLELARQIFIEIIEAFPTEMSKKDLGHVLLGICRRAIESKPTGLVMVPDQTSSIAKTNDLLQLTAIYNWQQKIQTPRWIAPRPHAEPQH